MRRPFRGLSARAVTESAHRVAAVDCGTNSTRLLILNGDGSTDTRLMRITRLGEGVDATGVLTPDATDRTLAVLAEYRRLVDRAGVAAVRLVATSATRDATNGAAFLRAASDVIGAPAELLDGQTEGQLAYAGATSSLVATELDDVVVDIGGGSTEIAVGHQGVVRATSLNVGCVRVSERFFRHDPPTGDELLLAESEVRSMVRAGFNELVGAGWRSPGIRLIGLAGSVTTLAALELGLEEYDPVQIHHVCLSLSAVDHWYKVLASESTAERSLRRAITPGREDVIAGGALILRIVIDTLHAERCLVSETDMLDGLAMSLLDTRGGSTTDAQAR